MNMKYPGLPWWLSGKELASQPRRLVQSLIWKDPTCLRAAKPTCSNYRACAHSSHTPHPEKPAPHNQRLAPARQN